MINNIMEIKYNKKIIKSGKYFELYLYKDKEIKKGFKRMRGLNIGRGHTKAGARKIMKELGIYDYHDFKKNEGRHLVHPDAEYNLFTELEEAQEKKKKANSSLSRTRTQLRRLINCNPHLDVFLTLTFAKSMPDPKEANPIFNKFIQRMRNHFKYFEYLAVIEFQDDTDYFGRVKKERGSVHYHLLCNFKLPAFKDKQERKDYEVFFKDTYWKQGFVSFKEVEHVDNMGAYFCKYLGKDMFDERMFGRKKYFCSQTLKRTEEIYGQDADKFMAKVSKDSKLLFEKESSSEWTGRIVYESYKIKNGKEEKVPVLTQKA